MEGRRDDQKEVGGDNDQRAEDGVMEEGARSQGIYYGPGMEGSLHREKGGDDSVVKTKSPGFGARGQGLASLFMGSDPWVRHKPSL